ncbi:hypothetical protein Tco_1470624 [Tanacetum coccineum]
MDKGESIGTPMATKPKLDADLSGKPVDQTDYHSTINMRLWYPKDSGFELTAFSDADHAGYLDTRKSSSGGIQFLALPEERFQSLVRRIGMRSLTLAELEVLTNESA